ncbi:RNA polymerase sigma factor [Anatilimnocola floriformis]|uniref:RNA polymerase sigma factor n=1 Tax=Anatilimnocola floriformis TaxID=2948575 RepID=UPI0020C41F46|nr:sigma-70 family RNA polymerase sigma factor [Anatilimnocola floriformis]
MSCDSGTPDFATTHWSLVLRAGGDNKSATAALQTLCERYWYPLYAYVRRRGLASPEAQDLTQEFFARLLEKNSLAAASPERGKFRAFLLTSLKNFLVNEWERGRAQKRGGGERPISLDLESAESRLRLEPAHELTPERLFERQWALLLLEHVMQRLQAEQTAAGKERQFELLKEVLVGGSDRLPFLAIATDLQISEEAARQAGSRLRKRYRELLREEVSHTVATESEVDDEIRNLFQVLAGG